LLRIVADDPRRIRVGRSDIEGWALLLDKPVDDELAALLPKAARYGGWIDRVGLWRATAAFALLAVVVVALGYSSPALIAPHVPMTWERKFGTAILGDYGEFRCRNPAGEQALRALVERLEPGATARGERQIDVAALDIDMFNAAALPGNHIVVFKGAVAEDVEPDALAGVVAHEIAHARRRHVAEALIRELGIGALVGMFAGQTAASAQQLVSLSYTRGHEAEADRDAIAMLKHAGISPLPTAKLFERLSKQEREGGSWSEFLQSHPLSKHRALRFAEAHDPRASYRPALSGEQAEDLAAICSEAGDPPRRSPAD
jgi:Zn-dependent protease with chaperone function